MPYDIGGPLQMRGSEGEISGHVYEKRNWSPDTARE